MSQEIGGISLTELCQVLTAIELQIDSRLCYHILLATKTTAECWKVVIAIVPIEKLATV